MPPQALSSRGLLFAAFFLALAGCSGESAPKPDAPRAVMTHADPFDVPIVGLSAAFEADFNDGDIAFSTPMTEADGLGPLYTRIACDACHATAVRGPGLVQKMSVVQADRITPADDQSELEYGHTVHPLTAGSAKTPIVPPHDQNVLVTTRVGPPVLGRGYMEAVEDSEIERVEREQAARADAIHGRINHVTYTSETTADDRFNTHQKGDSVIGRFGLKARVATLDDFTADAFQGDMGITSPLRPTEFKNPDGLMDDAKPGVDVGLESVALRAIYLRLLAIPRREANARGAALFEQTRCSVCHVPSLHTSADYPVEQLADVEAIVYTDFLLHAMGSALADGLPRDPAVDGEAGSLDWRTAPLLGLRFNRTFLHDGRARTVADAIRLHRSNGSEASDAIDRYDALSDDDRKALLDFVESL